VNKRGTRPERFSKAGSYIGDLSSGDIEGVLLQLHVDRSSPIASINFFEA